MGGAGPNDRQRRFADLVLAGRPASRAYVEAGYRAASIAAAEASASRLLRNAKVAAYLAERRAGAARQTETDLAWVLQQLRAVAEDKTAPHAAKVQALRVMADLCKDGHLPVPLGVTPPADLADVAQVMAAVTTLVAGVAAGRLAQAPATAMLNLIVNSHSALVMLAPDPVAAQPEEPDEPPVRLAWLQGAPAAKAGGE